MDIIIQIIIFAGLMLGLIIIFQVIDFDSNNENQDNKVLLGSATIETMESGGGGVGGGGVGGSGSNQQRVGPNPDLAIDMNEFNSQRIPEESFCKLVENDSLHTLDKDCNKLSRTNCSKVKCCGYLNDEKCVQGGEFGPTYRSDKDGNEIDIDTYFYMNKQCIGPGCSKDE